MGDIMKLNKKNLAVLFSTALLLTTTFGSATNSLADTNNTSNNTQTTSTVTSTNQTKNTNDQNNTATNTNSNDNIADNNTNATTNNMNNTNSSSNSSNTDSNNSATVAKTQASTSVDVSAIKTALLSEINNLRSQNGLDPLTNVEVLNSYAQERSDSFASNGTGIDNHVGWDSSKMAPYNLTAEENIGQLPLGTLANDPTQIAKTITEEFYDENNDAVPNYGHRKNMLNPYVGYIGFGVTVGSNGMIYFSQEIGNDATYAAKSSYTQRNSYYYTTMNDYANVSQYDSVDAERNSGNAAQDYVQNGDSYTFSDIRGGVSTRDSYVNMYDRDGQLYTNLRLAPGTDWASDIVSIINGTYYLHVSNNGFVKAADVLPWASFLGGPVITAKDNAPIYDDYGKKTTRYAAANSSWVTDRRSVDFGNNVKYYRIGTNAWLLESDLSNPIN